MNQEQLHQAFRRGQLAEQQSSKVAFTLTLDRLKQTPDGWFLGVDLAELAQGGVDQGMHSADPREALVAVARFEEGRGLVFKLMAVLVPDDAPALLINVAQPRNDLGDADEAAPSFEGSVPPSSAGDAAPAQPLKVDNAQSRSSTRVAPPATTPLDLKHGNQDPVHEAEDLLLVRRILMEVKQGRVQFLEDIEEMIRTGNNARRVRETLINVLPTWPATQTYLEEVRWDGLTGLATPLPMRSRLLIEGAIAGVTADDDVGEVRLARSRLITKEHDSAVVQNTLKTSGQVKLNFAAADKGLRLSLLQGWGTRVMLAAEVSRGLAIGSTYHLNVIDTFPARATDFQLQRYRRRLDAELMRQPPQDDFWRQCEPENPA